MTMRIDFFQTKIYHAVCQKPAQKQMALKNICKLSYCSTNSKYKEDLLANENFSDNFINLRNKNFFEIPNNPELVRISFDCLDQHPGVVIRPAHGTTTLVFVYEHGIMVAVDSRATAGGYIPWTDIKKIIELGPDKLGTMAGGAADNQFWLRLIRNEDRVYELRNKRRMTVGAASKLLSNLLYQYKGQDLVMASLITGFDKRGANLYYVDSWGLRLKHHYFSVGSGSSYAYGVLDTGYRSDMSEAEARDLARRAIYAASLRDFGTGNEVTLYHVTVDGWRHVETRDVSELHYLYVKEKQTSKIN